ncbi:MAG: GNAT family N-acetyltransferase [Fibrella sp.]|nr:GNAT family N-acetyltransferase [Armatimonadota bacterium]
MDPSFTVRPYASEVDLPRLVSLVQDAWSPERQPFANFHIGDLFWRLRDPECETRLFLWERGETLAGFVEWDVTEATLEVQIHPRFFGRELDSAMLRWAEEQAGDSLVTTCAADSNEPFLSLLASRGYTKQQDGTNHHCRPISDVPVEIPVLPEGYSVRSLHDASEIAARVKGHQSGWQSTKLTEERYRRLVGMPEYRTDFDLVVVAPDGDFVATANVWLDTNGAGLFEPLSTAPAHRRIGLGRALLRFGMEQLRLARARSVWVASVLHNPAATALYESVGLSVVRRDACYRKSAQID